MKVVRHHLPRTGLDAMSAYDITIAGAGPGGSVLALLAARTRYRVLLVERSHFDRPRFGETAPPELRQALTRVGLERLAQAPFCREAPEVLSVWGSDEPWSRHHIFSPYGTALHLDRRAFDEALALAARDAGADLKLGCAARFAAQPRGGYSVHLSTGERIRTNGAVLATGRAGGGLGLPYVRQYLDNNDCAAFVARGASRRADGDRSGSRRVVLFGGRAGQRGRCSVNHVSDARPQRTSRAFALVVGSLGTNHCRPQCVERVSSSPNSVGRKRTCFFCSIRCRRQLACDRRCAYCSRPAVRSRAHLGDRRCCFSDGAFNTHAPVRSCRGNASENPARR